MTSQKWQDETIVQRPIWWHYLSLSVPDKILRPDASLMWIGGSSNKEEIPKPTDGDIQLVSNFSLITGTISAVVQQVPNQPYIFNNDPEKVPRSEDEIISWTWKLFLKNTSNPTILLRFPMTKAFMTTGKSKRGWTTWTSSAVDNKRVFAAAPIVMDLANLNLNFHNHFKSLGGWTFEFYDYYTQDNLKYIDSRELYELEKLVDPLSYFERYKDTQILVMNAANDEFFLPDDTYAYWNNLVAATNGTALLRRFDNVGHSLSGRETDTTTPMV
ncbi:autocrine proliferation repressor A-like [Brachionus plicatilis]|uniref:Autocrine proliferation repressor A-like n=1 Tax=Brachionus plicatilis TaxID=10195 RepID=A0A3M7R7T6_BRAPC|nr:autocrine proliferation repressor A-like [Brachionus plicatilis]